MLKKHLLSIQKNPGMEKFWWLGGFFTNTPSGMKFDGFGDSNPPWDPVGH